MIRVLNGWQFVNQKSDCYWTFGFRLIPDAFCVCDPRLSGEKSGKRFKPQAWVVADEEVSSQVGTLVSFPDIPCAASICGTEVSGLLGRDR